MQEKSSDDVSDDMADDFNDEIINKRLRIPSDDIGDE
jgi:hypothetical protein